MWLWVCFDSLSGPILNWGSVQDWPPPDFTLLLGSGYTYLNIGVNRIVNINPWRKGLCVSRTSVVWSDQVADAGKSVSAWTSCRLLPCADRHEMTPSRFSLLSILAKNTTAYYLQTVRVCVCVCVCGPFWPRSACLLKSHQGQSGRCSNEALWEEISCGPRKRFARDPPSVRVWKWKQLFTVGWGWTSATPSAGGNL